MSKYFCFNSMHCGFKYNNERPVKMRFLSSKIISWKEASKKEHKKLFVYSAWQYVLIVSSMYILNSISCNFDVFFSFWNFSFHLCRTRCKQHHRTPKRTNTNEPQKRGNISMAQKMIPNSSKRFELTVMLHFNFGGSWRRWFKQQGRGCCSNWYSSKKTAGKKASWECWRAHYNIFGLKPLDAITIEFGEGSATKEPKMVCIKTEV